MSALLPFLKDRSELSPQSMQYFHFDEMEIHPGIHGETRQEGWSQIFRDLSRFRALIFRSLQCAWLISNGTLTGKLELDTELQRWVHEMADNITNLDMLGVRFGLSSTAEEGPYDDVQDNGPSEKGFWEFLAPKMLKKVGDEPHDAHSLLKRCIPY